MLARSVLDLIMGDETLTRHLRDSEARLLIEWLVEEAERIHSAGTDPNSLVHHVQRACRRSRAIGRFLDLWFNQPSRAAACQLWASERFAWPMPEPEEDPYSALEAILTWETDHAMATAKAA